MADREKINTLRDVLAHLLRQAFDFGQKPSNPFECRECHGTGCIGMTMNGMVFLCIQCRGTGQQQKGE